MKGGGERNVPCKFEPRSGRLSVPERQNARMPKLKRLEKPGVLRIRRTRLGSKVRRYVECVAVYWEDPG